MITGCGKVDLNIDELMENLSRKREIFHSEADFQHALAWQIQEMYKNLEIRLERGVVSKDGARMHIDIWLTDAEQKKVYLIELKYKKRKIGYIDKETGEEFKLPTQAARDTGSFDFLHDVSRIENLVGSENVIGGVAIFLTNENLYWEDEQRENTTFYQFRLDASRQITGRTMSWVPPEAAVTVSREETIKLKQEYPLEWREYSTVDAEPAETSRVFKWLKIEVGEKLRLRRDTSPVGKS